MREHPCHVTHHGIPIGLYKEFHDRSCDRGVCLSLASCHLELFLPNKMDLKRYLNYLWNKNVTQCQAVGLVSLKTLGGCQIPDLPPCHCVTYMATQKSSYRHDQISENEGK